MWTSVNVAVNIEACVLLEVAGVVGGTKRTVFRTASAIYPRRTLSCAIAAVVIASRRVALWVAKVVANPPLTNQFVIDILTVNSTVFEAIRARSGALTLAHDLPVYPQHAAAWRASRAVSTRGVLSKDKPSIITTTTSPSTS